MKRDMNQDESTASAKPTLPMGAGGGKPWGFWATSGFSALVIALFVIVHLVVVGPFRESIVAENPGVGQDELGRLLQQNGLFVSVSTILSGLLCVALIVLFARLRRGITVREYLALKRPDPSALRLWLIVLAGFIGASEGFKFLLGSGPVPDFALATYASARFPLLLGIAVVVVAPVFEEFFFRGFLFAGWSRSILGPAGTIFLTSLLWSATHGQYDWEYVVLVFAFGILAGVARYRTRSLAVPILLHGIVNLFVTLETVIVLQS